MTSAPAIGFEYRPSRWLPRLLWTVAVLAVLAIALSGLPPWLKRPLSAGIVLLVWCAVRRWQASPVRAAGWSADGNWSLHFADGSDAPATLASFRVLGDGVLLRLHTMPAGEHVLLLTSDNSDADTRRRLHMRLALVQAAPATPRI